MNRNSKRKRKRLLGFMMVLFILPLLVVGGCSLVGEGLTFEAIRARIGAKNAFESMLKGDYEDVASYIDFWGLSEDVSIISQSIIEGERERFVQGLEDFFSVKNRKALTPLLEEAVGPAAVDEVKKLMLANFVGEFNTRTPYLGRMG